ncbi:MAG: hypothetical protein GF364_00210 [Candidatus Lokiarchaeota archaeon]|nr:hypothetical protein [Candidatus Lokiarchaeota archaeon]
MEQLQKDEVPQLLDVGTLKNYQVKSERTVKDLLKELKLSDKYFAILVDGKRVGLDDVIKEGSSVIILPKIAGG